MDGLEGVREGLGGRDWEGGKGWAGRSKGGTGREGLGQTGR